MPRVIFEKGHKKLPNAGRKAGTRNANTQLLQDAVLMAADLVGQPKTRKVKVKTRTGTITKTEKYWDGEGGMVGYLCWLAVEHPQVFGPMLKAILPLQVKFTGQVQQKYTTIEEIHEALRKRGIDPRLLRRPSDPLPAIELQPDEYQSSDQTDNQTDSE